MARAKAEKAEKPDAAGDAGGAVSQADMVRDALGTLGGDAKPAEIQEYVQQKYGKELSRIIISNYKSNMKKGRLGGLGALGGAARGVGRPRKGAGGGAIRLEDLEEVRGLVRRLGAVNVRRLVDVLD